MAVPVGFAFVAACLSLGSFISDQLGSDPLPSPLNHVSVVLLWLAVALSLAVARRASASAWAAQVAAAMTAIAFVVVALVKAHTATTPSLDIAQSFMWGGEAEAMGLAALAFGLAGVRVRTPATKIVLVVLVCAAAACTVYAFWFAGGLTREVWYLAGITAGLVAASLAGRVERIRLPGVR